VDHDPEHAAAGRRLADPLGDVGREAAPDEARERGAILGEDADGGVLRSRQLARGVEDEVQHALRVELGDDLTADVGDAPQTLAARSGVELSRARLHRGEF
jgi:hypothetical protein